MARITVRVHSRAKRQHSPRPYAPAAATRNIDSSSHDWLDDAIAFEGADTRVAAGVGHSRAKRRLSPRPYAPTAATRSIDGSSHDWLDDAIAFEGADTRVIAGVANPRAKVRWRVSR